MHLPGRPASLHLADLVRLLHHYTQHGQVLPGLLPTTHDEHVRQVGEGASRGLQPDPRPTAQQHAAWRGGVDAVHGPGEGACQDAVRGWAGLCELGRTRCFGWPRQGVGSTSFMTSDRVAVVVVAVTACVEGGLPGTKDGRVTQQRRGPSGAHER